MRRDISSVLKSFDRFPALAILGPRQSGKTTLSWSYFKNHEYVNLEDLEMQRFATEDPKRFLKSYENEHGIIIDEFQRVPELTRYIQIEVDENKRPGFFVLTGSENIAVGKTLKQSLAGRVGILKLLPLSLHELKQEDILQDLDEQIFTGFYPRIYAEGLLPTDFYAPYTFTYIERDVRGQLNMPDVDVFMKFMRLCAGRIGQLLNVSDIATSVGVDTATLNTWLEVLENGFVLFRLQSHLRNFNVRVTKTPKIYFYDTGLVCYLLEMKRVKDLTFSPYRGSIFEFYHSRYL